MKPVDKRLLSHSPATRRWIAISGALTALGSTATIGMGVLIGQATAKVAEEGTTSTTQVAQVILLLIVLALLRVAVSWAQARYGQAAAADVIADLRTRTLAALALRDPRTVDVTYWRTLVTVGIGGLSPYISSFLPALVAMALSTPIALAAVACLDIPSAVVAVVTLPLIPLFMWLVGLLTQGRTEERLRDIGVVRGQIFDLIQGLPTLQAHRVTEDPKTDPSSEIARLSAAHRTSTMAVLRIAFLSGMVLEFLATLSVALVAVGIGFRLLAGDMTLGAGLAVLIIIPEVYGPVREVGKRFHDAQDGLISADAALSLLDATSTNAADLAQLSAMPPYDAESPVQEYPSVVSSDSEQSVWVTLDNLSVAGRDGLCPARLTFTAQPGQITVLAGENGVGKSTALLAISGIITEGVTGDISIAKTSAAVKDQSLLDKTDTPLSPRTTSPISASERSKLCAYLPQRPILDASIVGDNSHKSLGQRHRTALQAELSDPSRRLVLLDEPTAHLDEVAAQQMLADICRHASAGATIIIASHDPLVLKAADEVVEVRRQAFEHSKKSNGGSDV